MKRRTWRGVDLFCGAGGTTTGAAQAGVEMILAVNHWRTAIFTHEQNHPATRHICARLEHIDIRHDRTIPDFDILLASPECTHFSVARGGQPVDDQKRQPPFGLLDWLEARRPRFLSVENVREFRDWGPLRNIGTQKAPKWRPDPKHKGETFAAWVRLIEALGYRVDHQLLNSADFGAATKRVRLFVTAVRNDVYRRGRKEIPWPEPTHAGKWKPAWSIIDWSLPIPSIFGRRRPLEEKTLRRIEVGLKKFVGPFAVTLRNNMDARDLRLPVPTITAAGEHHGLAIPFIVNYHGGRNPKRDGTERSNSVSEPLPVIPTENRYAVVMPYLLDLAHSKDADRSASASQPVGTITTADSQAMVFPFMMKVNHDGPARIYSLDEPLRTISTKNGHAFCIPFVTRYNGTGTALPITEPLGTLTTKDRFGLAMISLIQTMQELGVADVGFRMFAPHELAAAQGFPAGYYLHGNRGDRVKQIGNAVCPPVARAICETLIEAA